MEEEKLMYMDEKGNKLYGYSQVSLDKLVVWVKVLTINFVVLVVFIIILFLWLKLSGIGHNIIYELSPK